MYIHLCEGLRGDSFGGRTIACGENETKRTSCQEQYLEVQEVIPSLAKLKVSMSH